jgi:hypothetical protein
MSQRRREEVGRLRNRRDQDQIRDPAEPATEIEVFPIPIPDPRSDALPPLQPQAANIFVLAQDDVPAVARWDIGAPLSNAARSRRYNQQPQALSEPSRSA